MHAGAFNAARQLPRFFEIHISYLPVPIQDSMINLTSINLPAVRHTRIELVLKGKVTCPVHRPSDPFRVIL